MSTSVPIYAVDFDGTLCESQWPGIGAPNMKLIQHLIQRRQEGCKVILWTCRIEDRLQEAVEWCKQHGLQFDAVNDNLPENIEKYGSNCRKVYATCYIDDLAMDKEKYGLPYKESKRTRLDVAIDQTGSGRTKIVSELCPNDINPKWPIYDANTYRLDSKIKGCRGIECEECWEVEADHETI